MEDYLYEFWKQQRRWRLISHLQNYENLGPVSISDIRSLIVRSREVSKPRDWHFELSHRYEIWEAPSAAEVPVKFQSDWIIHITNLAASRRKEILRYDVLSDIETGPGLWHSNQLHILLTAHRWLVFTQVISWCVVPAVLLMADLATATVVVQHTALQWRLMSAITFQNTGNLTVCPTASSG